MQVLCAIYALMFVLEMTRRDPAATYHAYESTPARVLAIVRLAVLAWFAWCVKRTRAPGTAYLRILTHACHLACTGASSAPTTRRTAPRCAASTSTSPLPLPPAYLRIHVVTHACMLSP